jgi:Flp pilus assembly pilin Flp
VKKDTVTQHIVLVIRRFLADDEGQDLIEYALLSGLVGAVGLAVYPEIMSRMSAAYVDWMTDTQAAWQPCDPGAC